MLSLFSQTTSVTDIFLETGILGATIVVLAVVIIYQQRKLDKRDEKYENLQDLRLEDSKQIRKEVTEVLDNTANSMRILSEKIEISKREQ